MWYNKLSDVFSDIGVGAVQQRRINVELFADFEKMVFRTKEFDMTISCFCWWGTIYKCLMGGKLNKNLYNDGACLPFIEELGISKVCADMIWNANPAEFWQGVRSYDRVECIKRVRLIIEIFHGRQEWIIIDERTAPIYNLSYDEKVSLSAKAYNASRMYHGRYRNMPETNTMSEAFFERPVLSNHQIEQLTRNCRCVFEPVDA